MKICKILKDDLRGQSIFQSKESKRLTERANRMRDEHISGSQRYYSSSLRAICEALCYVYDTNSKQRTFEDRLCALRFYLSAIRQDVVVDSRAQFLYGKYLCSLDTELFPISEPASENPAPSRDVDISVTDTLTLFCKAESTGRSPADVARNGLWTSRKYMATYYPEIDMVKVSNGRHHIGAACLDRPSRGEIIIPCMECSLLESFRRFSTDGGLWLDMSKPRSRQTDFTDVKRSDVVKDFRLALIFSLAQAIEKFTRNDPDMPVNLRLASYLQPFCPDSVVLKRNDTSDRDVACERVETKLRKKYLGKADDNSRDNKIWYCGWECGVDGGFEYAARLPLASLKEDGMDQTSAAKTLAKMLSLNYKDSLKFARTYWNDSGDPPG